MEFITDLPSINNFDSILVVVDQGLSKGVIIIPCNKTITAEETGKLLLENLYKRFGLPDKIISDRGPQYTSKAFVKLLKLLGIKSALSTAYHPQTDGTTERVNQEIKHISLYIAPHTLMTGYQQSIPWNSHIIIEDMLIDRKPHLSWCSETHQ